MKRNKSLGIVFLLCVLVLTISVTAIGIRPASTEIVYDLTKEYTGTIWVVNNDKLEFMADVNIEGEISSVVSVDKSKLDFKTDTEYLPINFKLNLSSEIPPGTHLAYITIEQKLKDNDPSVIYSKLVLRHKIVVFGKYPDKFVKADLDYADKGENVEIISELNNLGKEEIKQAYTTFTIQGISNKSSGVINTEISPLSYRENKKLSKEIPKSELGEGEFIISALTHYDNLEVEISKKMILGKPKIEITYFDQYFLSGEVNPYTLELLNNWNNPVENIYVDVNVLKDNVSVDSFRTKSVDINQMSRKKIQDYLDGTETTPGEYLFEMVVNYWNNYKMDQKVFKSEFLTADKYKSAYPQNLVGGSIVDIPYLSRWWLFPSLLLVLFLGGYVIYRYIHREEYE